MECDAGRAVRSGVECTPECSAAALGPQGRPPGKLVMPRVLMDRFGPRSGPKGCPGLAAVRTEGAPIFRPKCPAV